MTSDNHDLFLKNKFKEVAKLIPPSSKVLDIGCNNGHIRYFLNKPEYYGIDLEKDLIEQLKKQKISAKQADINEDALPFEKEKFDYVLLLDILEHVIDPKKLINDSKQRLKPDGRIIITLPNDYHLLNKIRFLFNRHLTKDPFAPYGHLHYFPIKTGENFLKQNDLKILKKIPIPPTKPSFLPKYLKNFLGKNFPQSFARDILYLLEVIKLAD